MMKTSKILININNLSEIDDYKKIGINNFLFAIPEFSIGYKTIEIDSIPDDVYILVNRVMDSKSIENFKNIIPSLKRFKGIVYEDVGVFNVLKDTAIPLIWNQNHFATNFNSINFWLNQGCQSAVISNEITREEINDILEKTTKPLVLTTFAKNQIMYSRRTLLTNFNKYNNLSDTKETILNEPNTKHEFKSIENEFGTIIYNNEYFNYLNEKFDDDKILYYLIMNLDLQSTEIIETINGKELGNDGFLNTKTVYRLSDYKTKGVK